MAQIKVVDEDQLNEILNTFQNTILNLNDKIKMLEDEIENLKKEKEQRRIKLFGRKQE